MLVETKILDVIGYKMIIIHLVTNWQCNVHTGLVNNNIATAEICNILFIMSIKEYFALQSVIPSGKL